MPGSAGGRLAYFKVKVGGKPEDDLRRLSFVARGNWSPITAVIDSNQRWDVYRRFAASGAVASEPLVAEEPTHPTYCWGMRGLRRR